MKTQLLQDFNESRTDHAGTRHGAPGRHAAPEAPPVPPAPDTSAQPEPPAAAAGAAGPVAATVPAPEPAAPAPATPSPQAPAAPLARPAARPRPAVWQRPQQVDADATVHFPPPTMPPMAPPPPSILASEPPAPPPAPPTPPMPPPPQAQAADGTQATTPLPGRARGFAPQPTAYGLTPPLSDTTVREWPPGSRPAGGDPDWLTERLARDTAMHDRTEWNGRWKTRFVSWGAAGVLLALVAGGGLWLYEQSRVEGALVVVANTNPAPEANTLRPDRPAEPPVPPVAAPVASADKSTAILAPVSALPSATLPAARPAAPETSGTATGTGAGAGIGAVGGSVGPSAASSAGAIDTSSLTAADRTVKPVALDGGPPEQPKRGRSHSRKQTRSRQEASAASPSAEPSARQRREETLLQCRAHGYDERQCLQRGCEMTRYGFACKG